MIEREKIIQLVEGRLTSSDNYLVDVIVKPGNFIVVEIDNDQAVGIDDCAELSRYLESHLNRDEDDFELEVGSSGITSSFKVTRQYIKNVGNEVEILLKSGIKLTGMLKSADEKGVTLSIGKKVKSEGTKRKITIEEEQWYTYDEIKYTKYLIRFK
jgi:ribosome maturation factor RimP